MRASGIARGRRLLSNFIAHEPAVAEIAGGRAGIGGAALFVAEQTLAINRAGVHGHTSRARVLCPRPPAGLRLPPGLPALVFEPERGSPEELAGLYASDPAWLDRFDRALGPRVPLVNHLAAACVAAALDRPFVCAMHSVWPSVRGVFTGRADPREALARPVLARADAILVATRAEKTLLLARAPSASVRSRLARVVHVLPGGLNPRVDRLARSAAQPALRRAWRRRLLPEAASDALVFYSVGRLVPHKNPLRVLAAFLEVAAQRRNVHLLIAGPGGPASYAARLHARLQAAPPALRARVRWTGSLPIEAAHLAGDVLVHAPTCEAWGRVIDEASALGNASVLSALPTLAEKAGFAWRCAGGAATGERPRFDYAPPSDGAAPLLVDPASVSQLAAALDRAAGDPGWRAACGRRNSELARGLRWRRHVPRLLAIWRRTGGGVPVRSGAGAARVS